MSRLPASPDLLHEACETAGRVTRLAGLLGVARPVLARWLQGEEEPPPQVYQACADIILLRDDAT